MKYINITSVGILVLLINFSVNAQNSFDYSAFSSKDNFKVLNFDIGSPILEITNAPVNYQNLKLEYRHRRGSIIQIPLDLNKISYDRATNTMDISDFYQLVNEYDAFKENIIIYCGKMKIGTIWLNPVNNGKRVSASMLRKKYTKQDDNTSALLSENAENYVKEKYGALISAHYDSRLNQVVDGKTIHIFIDEGGRYIFSSLPTTAKEDNIYVFHVVFMVDATGKDFNMTYTGDYNPTMDVYGAPGPVSKQTEEIQKIAELAPVMTERVFGAIGPFSNSFSVKIYQDNKDDDPILNKTVKVAPVHAITLTAGLYSTFLQNPQNIKTFVKPNGDTTLLADDPTQRGMITIMMTFYPHPRNILFPLSRNWKEKIAFCVGTDITKNLAENFFGGVSYDIAKGIAITGGAHYGRHTIIKDKPSFNFGNDKFTGDLDQQTIKRWDLSAYLGINIDFQLLSLIFNSTPK